ncbi:GNAT family N-acetyltransferase [Candidatus Woesearchaeota archaeon]|nr:GNAT family N-acetyltransferase [Candidatus Woesearchaeota archaeon]
MIKEQTKIEAKDISIEVINERHCFNNFKSSEQELINFLVEDALENQKLKLSITFLWFYLGEIVSYITLLSDRITLDGELQQFFKGKDILYRSLPALKIGRLCVDEKFQKRGLGRLMIIFAIEKAKEIAMDKAGCRFITVEPKEPSVGFYTKLNFKPIKTKNEQHTFYLDVLRL